MSFCEVKINDISDILTLKFPEYWVFRGQEKGFPLKTSIERLLDELSYDYYWLVDPEWDIERSFIKNFIQKAKLANIAIASQIESVALMQHHGMSTRFLDFTESLFVALYFAVKNFDNLAGDGVVWAINLAKLYKCHVLSGKVRNVNCAGSDRVECNYRSENITQKGFASCMVFSGSLYDYQLRQNTRFKRQKGRFLTFNNGGGFEKSLYESFNLSRKAKQEKPFRDLEINLESKLIKFVIPQENKADLFSHLNRMNINEKFLFPNDDPSAPVFEKICKEMRLEFCKTELVGRNS